jgi:hypothetical protein
MHLAPLFLLYEDGARRALGRIDPDTAVPPLLEPSHRAG